MEATHRLRSALPTRAALTAALMTLVLAAAPAARSDPTLPGGPDRIEQGLIADRDLALSTGDHPRAMALDLQIARHEGLQGRFDAARARLAHVAADLRPDETAARCQYELETGRLIRTEGNAAAATPHFETALRIAQGAGFEALEIDALHMLAIVAPDTDHEIAQTRAAIALASRSHDPKARAWRPTLWNNLGESLDDAGRRREALEAFKRSRAACASPVCARIADWKAARMNRELGCYRRALAILSGLERRWTNVGPKTEPAFDAGDGPDYVHEEMGRDHLALAAAAASAAQKVRETATAKALFAQASAELASEQAARGSVAPELSGTQRLVALRALAN